MTAIIDYKMGNLHSVKNALDKLETECIITSNSKEIDKADRLILPGVGAFPDAMKILNESGLKDTILDNVKNRKPMLGICLGMQLLFERSYEFGKTDGLSLIPGEVVLIDAHGMKIPHIGWNSLEVHSVGDPLAGAVKEGDYVYFVHSYRAQTEKENILLSCTYGENIPALVRSPLYNVWGAQFHPEKSHDVGLNILRRFATL